MPTPARSARKPTASRPASTFLSSWFPTGRARSDRRPCPTCRWSSSVRPQTPPTIRAHHRGRRLRHRRHPSRRTLPRQSGAGRIAHRQALDAGQHRQRHGRPRGCASHARNRPDHRRPRGPHARRPLTLSQRIGRRRADGAGKRRRNAVDRSQRRGHGRLARLRPWIRPWRHLGRRRHRTGVRLRAGG
jgi:hypothetical protein